MTTADYDIGYGAKVYVGRGTPKVYTEIPYVGEMSLPKYDVDKIEITSHSSPNRMKEYISGLVDGGECEISHLWSPDSELDNMFVDMLASGEKVTLKFVVKKPNTVPVAYYTTIHEAALIGYERTIPVNDVMKATAIFKMSKKVAE